MKTSALPIVSGNFEVDFNLETQRLIELRRTKMSQEEISVKIGVSLKTIQRFENYKSQSIKVMYNYKTILE